MTKEYDKNYHNKFDYLIPKISGNLFTQFFKELEKYPEFQKTIDTSPLLNMTTATLISTLMNILNVYKKSTVGEISLIQNIEIVQNNLIKLFKDLPFVKSVEIYETKK